MTHTNRFLGFVVTVLCAALILNSTVVYAAGVNSEELRREAFLRGGDAIRAALAAKPDSAPAVSKAIAETIPATPPAATPQDTPKSGTKSKLVWAGLIAGFTVSGILIYHYAVGPGASVRNCSTCK